MAKILTIYTFALLAAVARAAPHFGYHYERNSNGNSVASKESNSFFNTPAVSNTIGNSVVNKESHSFFNTPALSNSLSVPFQTEHKGNSQQFNGDKYLPPETTTLAPIITKQFYLVSAPDEVEEVQKTKHFVIGRPQKNYRVVFIKAPSSQNTNLKLSAEYAPQEEKTVIYVLSKKDNEVNVGDIATPPPTQAPKPEVFFIKYKTQEEASAAQKEIQEQYDSLGGTSEFLDQGILPVKSVIGSLDGLAPNGGYDYKKVQNGVNSPIKDFLQPARFYY
ncbi:uncharacterized protein LOC119673328 [Teleopsis dalmanni]|uniref:uncharacterized protein LOC119673328 n=1 Tax=Teleopsis dalmanni TaxID=139649 RepID=UPI0018CDFF4A|nr:uncharacterized protein LOC119673328 [Teleopsis dalmanni]